MQTSAFRGSLTVTSFRLCSRAPWTTSSSAAISGQCIDGSRVEQVFPSAPRPVVGSCSEACLHWVVQDVVDGVSQVLLVADEPRREPVAEEVHLRNAESGRAHV